MKITKEVFSEMLKNEKLRMTATIAMGHKTVEQVVTETSEFFVQFYLPKAHCKKVAYAMYESIAQDEINRAKVISNTSLEL